MKRNLIYSFAVLALLGGGLALLNACAGNKAAGSAPGSAPAAKKAPKRWRNPMDPNIIQDHPGKDSMGMDYIPIDDAPESSTPPTQPYSSLTARRNGSDA